MDLFQNGLITFSYAGGTHRYHFCANLSRNVGVVSEQTSGQTNGRTDRHLDGSNNTMVRQKVFGYEFFSCALIRYQLDLKPSPLLEDSK